MPLPPSRKVRMLLAYLVLSPHPVSRSRLCDLLWDVPNDPRGELRWCLSKLRALLDEDDRRRVITTDDGVRLDLAGAWVDVLELERAAQAKLDEKAADELAALCDQIAGDLLDGIEIDGSAELAGWLTAQRARCRSLRVDVLRALVTRTSDAQSMFRRLDAWLQLAPYDARAHHVMLDALARAGRLRDADQHLAATIRAFEAEGVDWSSLRETWHANRRQAVGRVAVDASARITSPRELSISPLPSNDIVAPATRRRAAVAVMPFVERSANPAAAGRVAEGLTEDIIMQLAKLRVLFVIARGSVFALAERGVDAQEAGRVLNVDYVVSGTLRREGPRLTVVTELADAREGRIVWTEALEGVAADETFAVLDSIVERIVAAIAEEIESEESRRAVLKQPTSLDAWEAYHRGLWHMYKFTGNDNREAERFFLAAVRLDPTFARAYAGLSFTHFQNVFLDLTGDRQRQIDLALDTASQSLGTDAHDPAAHWAMGRALWLRGEQRESLASLERCVELSPNFALGHYTL
ncbi:MAG TPA: hypothetical protein VLB44_11395, partial [Kofleriaceae bacterium]|nr:hypothetical protein [Kofleriaceae bacterium]